MYLIVYVNLLFRNVTYFEQMRLIFFIYTYVLQYGTEYTNPKGACLFWGICLFKNGSSQKKKFITSTVFRKQTSGPYAQALLSFELGSTWKKK